MPFRHTLLPVKFDWDPEKNKKLKEERNVSFEEVALLLGNGILWKVSKHWNPKKYPNQRVFLIPIDNYIYAVPFVEEKDGTIFLKTIFQSRKLTKIYRAEMEK